jgi:RHS repeat-associated protein
VKDTPGNAWTFEYDLRGRQIASTSPDSGRSTKVYNDAGDVTSTTDSRNRTLAYTYDASGRRIAMREGSETGPLRAEWRYDTLSSGVTVRGRQVKSIRYQGEAQYVSEVLGFTALYQPTGQSITIPSTETGLGGTYTYVTGYTANGLPLSARMPGIGGQPTETLTTGYDQYGRPVTLRTDVSSTDISTTIVNGTSYTRYGETAVIGLRTDGGRWLDTGRTYEEGTRRLKRILTTRETTPSAVMDQNLSHDPAGNIVSLHEAVAGDTQCFAYDGLRRLTEAWTPGGGDCAAARSQASLGGPAPYWESFGYDATGNRATAIKRTKTTSATWTHTYPAAGTAQPHTLRRTTVTGSTNASATYTYDPTGRTLTRPADGTSGSGQTLTWDIEGELESSTDASGRTEYLYDTDGNRLVRRDPAGSTLYLPGQELRYTKADGVKSGTRFYSHAGHSVAVRNTRGLTWQVADHQGTVVASVTTADQVVTTRRQTPFGENRGDAVAWNTDKGFVGGTNDNTNLVHLSAREYDPVTGRFVSADALTDHDNPQQMNGYSYANNSPVTMSDPDGNMLIGDDYGRIRVVPASNRPGHYRVVYPKKRFVGPVYRPRPTKKAPFVGPPRVRYPYIKRMPKTLGQTWSCIDNPARCYQRPPTVRDCKSNPSACYQRPPTNTASCIFHAWDCGKVPRVRSKNPEPHLKPFRPAPPAPAQFPSTKRPYDQLAFDFCFIVCVGVAGSQKSDGKYQVQFQFGGLGCCGPGIGWSQASVGAEKQGLQMQTCAGFVIGGCYATQADTPSGEDGWDARGLNLGAKGLGGFMGWSYSWCFYGCDPGEGYPGMFWPPDYPNSDEFHNPFG